MEEPKYISDIGMYHFTCCPPKKYMEHARSLSEENKEKCLMAYNSLREISPGLLDGKDILEKIGEIQKNQKSNLNIKEKKGYYSIDVQMQDISIELAHFEAVKLTK